MMRARAPIATPPALSREPRWHRLALRDVAQRLGTDPTRGLTAAEATRRPFSGLTSPPVKDMASL
jgi:Cation transporter/ATPase, N-terminus